jgi:hypothetical protein
MELTASSMEGRCKYNGKEVTKGCEWVVLHIGSAA